MAESSATGYGRAHRHVRTARWKAASTPEPAAGAPGVQQRGGADVRAERASAERASARARAQERMRQRKERWVESPAPRRHRPRSTRPRRTRRTLGRCSQQPQPMNWPAVALVCPPGGDPAGVPPQRPSPPLLLRHVAADHGRER